MTAGAPPQTQFSIGVMVSGGGTSLQNLIDRIANGRLAGVRVAVVIASRDGIAAIDRARKAGIPIEVVRPGDSADVDSFSLAIRVVAERHGVRLLVQGGWLCYWRPGPSWEGRVINIHPALLPEFGGRGYYGRNVHSAVLAAGRALTGATVHLVDDQYDHGQIVLQRTCPVQPEDSPESLAERVFTVECELLPRAIELARDGRLPIFPVRR